MKFTVEEARQVKEFEGKFGKRIVYKVRLTDGSKSYPDVELVQKPEEAAPAKDDTLEGSIGQSNFGPKFEKPRMSRNGGGGGGGSRDFKADPEKLAYENRRSALHAAVQRANSIGPEVTATDILAVAKAFHGFIVEES